MAGGTGETPRLGLTGTPTGTGHTRRASGAGKAKAPINAPGRAHGKTSGRAAAPQTYDLSTSAGKIAYLRAEINAIEGLRDTEYAQYKDRPAYAAFLQNVNAEIRELKRMMANVDNPNARVDISGGMTPEKVAAMTIESCADRTNLLTTEERMNKAFGELR